MSMTSLTSLLLGSVQGKLRLVLLNTVGCKEMRHWEQQRTLFVVSIDVFSYLVYRGCCGGGSRRMRVECKQSIAKSESQP